MKWCQENLTMEKKIMKKAYCRIERTITRFEKLSNGKWICASSGCSYVSPQYKKLPKIPDFKIERHLKIM